MKPGFVDSYLFTGFELMRKLIDFHLFMFINFQECIVVCVVSLEEVNITPGNIPYQYCREIRTEGIGASKQLDYIIIPASAAIVATVIIAVIIFIAFLKTSQKKQKGKVRLLKYRIFLNHFPL